MASPKSEQVWYWLACGVLAFATVNRAAKSSPGWVYEASGQAVHALDRFSGRVIRQVELASWMFGNRESPIEERAQLAVTRVRTKVDCVHARLDRHQVSLDRMEARRRQLQAMRVEILERQAAMIACPRENVARAARTIIIHSGDGNI